MADAFILDALRTPRGRRRGSLAEVHPVQLAGSLLGALAGRGIVPDRIDDVVLGTVSAVGEQGGVLARSAVRAAELPVSVPGMQVNRYCASGLEAVTTAAGRVAAGFDELIVAGGVESMSRVPLGADGGPYAVDPANLVPWSLIPQGVSADAIASRDGFSRADVDAYAVQSQQRAAAAWEEGRFSRSIVPVSTPEGVLLLDRDEHMRPGTTADALAGLAPAFAAYGGDGFDAVVRREHPEIARIEHVHTAGNSSGIVDGAGLVVVGSAAAASSLGLAPRARIVATTSVGSDPTLMLTGPVAATEKVLARAGLSHDDIDLYEINEAFASVVLHWLRETGVDPERTNVSGGAIALGHPLGATGAMLIGTALDELERRDQQRALVSLCVGGGMASAMVIERV
ncbi:acetyl-CoA C-acetyltransferase [Agrococcus sp. ARC_14]|uniref:acetyl-CoA C-acetyltransferase n=1 Tax=Agrococcus sp. ARC_14 TaxID=2919927 RepID=UPI001F0586AD|nr:acetyl-CoA C-acetyltransferase [Agrococcus sp. ARC_14]MCH1883548.1 acetyl-CoA C-acetyltransferase [Agrococcus sp. ARC_14]